MNKEEQGKKTSQAEKLPAGKDDKAPVPGKPAALSDADLDNVAGGGTYWQGQILSGAVSVGLKTVPVPLTPAPK